MVNFFVTKNYNMLWLGYVKSVVPKDCLNASHFHMLRGWYWSWYPWKAVEFSINIYD